MIQHGLFLLVSTVCFLASCYTGRLRHIAKLPVQDSSTIDCTLPAEFELFDTSFNNTDLAGMYIFIINQGHAGITLHIDSGGRFTEQKWTDIPSIVDNKIRGKWHRNVVEIQFNYNKIFQKKNRMTIIKTGHVFFLVSESRLDELLILLTVHKKIIQDVNRNWENNPMDLYKNGTWAFLRNVCFIKCK